MIDDTTCRFLFVLAIFALIPQSILAERHRKRDLRSRGTVIYAETDCPYPCTCPVMGQEVCRECEECPRQLGEPCSEDRPCDRQRGLVCRYKHGDSEGVCRESTGVPCIVHNKTYEHGETFSLDCRTQCACQNGTYGCSSLCPQEHISPRGNCQHPRLVDVPEQCCREWMCDSQTEQPPACQPAFSRWSSCSSDCGAGLSSRRSNLNARCLPDTEIRICQTRRCQEAAPTVHHKNQHHLRRGHECKATHRLSSGVFLRFGPCRSRKRFRPKYCGLCPIPGMQCAPSLSTTVKVEFVCDGPQPDETTSDLLPEYLEPGEDFWEDASPWKGDNKISRLITVSVQWVLKCRCEPEDHEPTSSTGEVILHRVHRTAAP
ncbi:CCN family member 1 isoform X2 [Tribolium castaneum]|uniref:CCN family member 1 isoform X2 n=1 Tax=Tribolium castaneum TaxID=7070 RepID=UPI00077D9F80|nr:PREDICTED: protein CYR61 isoform X2 [Tribolium castaneum]|eukprot:XP_015833038.1 PREDICTED: protein CYR61 isoform X2 [Tribolium castaneum]